jgi:glycosyltransferase involved in cell wall biosynthesis
MQVDVSVVIPTRNRPHLIARALRSVFAQTFGNFEVIVVIDGPDEATERALQAETDPRLHVVVNHTSLTAAGARNVGVARASGNWIAFLDDDDEWLPQKLERQLAIARSDRAVLVTCRSRVITPTASYIWPRDLYDGKMPLDEYLFERRSVFSGSSFIQTSSFLLPRSVALAWPFDVSTPHDDWDFILRLSKRAGGRIATVPDVLVNLYAEEARPSLSNIKSWQASFDWLNRNQSLFTRRGYAGFCLGVVGARAADEDGDATTFLRLLRQSFRAGSPRALELLAFAAFWLISKNVRRRLRGIFSMQRIGGARRVGALLPHVAPDDSPGHT